MKIFVGDGMLLSRGGYLSFKSGQTKVFHNILSTPQIHNYLNLAIFYLESLSQQQAPCH